jgi:hypothetical protein
LRANQVERPKRLQERGDYILRPPPVDGISPAIPDIWVPCHQIFTPGNKYSINPTTKVSNVRAWKGENWVNLWILWYFKIILDQMCDGWRAFSYPDGMFGSWITIENHNPGSVCQLWIL